MSKKINDTRISSIECALKEKNAISYLEEIRISISEEEVLKRLKYAGYFVTDKNQDLLKKEKKDEIDKWIKSIFGEDTLRIFLQWEKEGKALDKKKKRINKKIANYLDIFNRRKISPYYLLEYFNAIVSPVTENDQLTKTGIEQLYAAYENIILGLGTLIRGGLLRNAAQNVEETKKYNDLIEEISKTIQAQSTINDLIRSWMFGDVEVKRSLCNRITLKEKKGTISDRMVSFNEYMWLNQAKTYGEGVESIIVDEEEKYLRVLEAKVKEFFYTETLEEKYIDVSLKSWIKIYAYFYALVYKEKNIYRINKDKLIKALFKRKIDSKEISNALESLTFGNDSNDLFSSFMIADNEDYILLPSLIKIMEPLKSMMSLFTRNQGGRIERKGTSFENYVAEIIGKAEVIQNVKTSYNGESYELDVLLYLDNSLFVFECKTQFQHENVRDYCRNLQELEYYIKKFKRNVDYFAKDERGKCSINSRFQKKYKSFDIDNVEIVPIILSNITYPFTRMDEVFILDATKLYNYFMDSPPKVFYIDNRRKELIILPLLDANLFRKGAGFLIEYLNNNRNYTIDIEVPIRPIDISLSKWDIYSTRLLYDYDLYDKYIVDFINEHRQCLQLHHGGK